jgi:hypothetical protein
MEGGKQKLKLKKILGLIGEQQIRKSTNLKFIPTIIQVILILN